MGQHNAADRSLGQLLKRGPAHGQGGGLKQLALTRSHARIWLHQNQLEPLGQIRPIPSQHLGQIQGQGAFARTTLHQGQPLTRGRRLVGQQRE